MKLLCKYLHRLQRRFEEKKRRKQTSDKAIINNKTENISRSNFATGYRVRNQKQFDFCCFFFLICFICLKLGIAKGLDAHANKTMYAIDEGMFLRLNLSRTLPRDLLHLQTSSASLNWIAELQMGKFHSDARDGDKSLPWVWINPFNLFVFFAKNTSK